MKQFFLFILIVVVLGALFFGFIEFIGKTMKAPKMKNNPFETSDQLREQSEKIDDLRKEEKRLMEERQRRLREAQERLKYR